MRSYGVIGDAHLGFKAYGSDRRTQEVIDTFEVAVDLLAHCPVVLIAGDLFDDSTCPNLVKKALIAIKEKHADQKWLILGGNHDSTKTYSSVSALDVFGEVHNVSIVNSFKSCVVGIEDLNVLCIPHMQSQQQFLTEIDELLAQNLYWDACLLHCMVNSGLDLGPNDLNIDLYRLSKLAEKNKHVWIGHQHGASFVLDNAIIPGGTVEFNFGEMGPKYVYEVFPDNGTINKLVIPQKRKLKKIDLQWTGPVDLLKLIAGLDASIIYKLTVEAIPAEEYSSAKAALDTALSQFTGDVVYSLEKTGHKEIAVTEIDASFDLLEEFIGFATKNNLSNQERMVSILEDSISEVLAEEEDL